MAEREAISVFILAENRLLREALAQLLDKKNDIRIVDAAASSAQLAGQVAAAAPDVLLSDRSLLALPDLQWIEEIRGALPRLRMLLMGMEDDRRTFVRAVCEGVAGYVLKEATAAELASAVRLVAEGRAVCPPSLCMVLFEIVAAQSPQVFRLRLKYDLGLTRREQQLVEMIDHGLSNKEIAAQLKLSEQTIKNHVHRMLRKLGAPDRLAAAELCRSTSMMARAASHITPTFR